MKQLKLSTSEKIELLKYGYLEIESIEGEIFSYNCRSCCNESQAKKDGL